MSQQQDQRFFRNYSLIIGLLAVMVLIFISMGLILGTNKESYLQQRVNVVAERTAPVGKVHIAGVSPASDGGEAGAAMIAETHEEMGQRVYGSLCFTCHGTPEGAGGLPNIPHFGDLESWAPRIAQGAALLYERALNGFTGESGIPMPARGGNPSLSDDEIKAAVDFIVSNNQAGAPGE